MLLPKWPASNDWARPPAAQSRPQLGVEACAGPFQVAKTRAKDTPPDDNDEVTGSEKTSPYSEHTSRQFLVYAWKYRDLLNAECWGLQALGTWNALPCRAVTAVD